MNASLQTVTFTINGREVQALRHETLIEVADREGIEIPRLCYMEGMEAVGNCRSCMVEIDGERVLAPSCCRHPSQGMKVTHRQRARREGAEDGAGAAASDMPEKDYTRHNEVDEWAASSASASRASRPRAAVPQQDATHAAITVNLDACIQCTRCVRACRDEQVNDVIGLAFRGQDAKIVFDQDDPMGASTCVACGECVQACPTGALMPARDAALSVPDKQVDSVCPYCGVGCQLTYNVKDNKILYVEGRDGPANHGRLCVKGRYGFDYAHHPHRLTKPLIRRAGVPKTGDFTMDPDDGDGGVPRSELGRSAGAGRRHAGAHPRYARQARAGRLRLGQGQQRGSLPVPEAGAHRLRQQQRRPLHPPVPRLLGGGAAGRDRLGRGLEPGDGRDPRRVVIVIGANPTVNHPVAATWIKNAVRTGTKLIMMDPRRSELARHAHRTCSSSRTPTSRC
jgi:formate dehydrogenase major subunit